MLLYKDFYNDATEKVRFNESCREGALCHYIQGGHWGFNKYRPRTKITKYLPKYFKYRPHSIISTKYRPQKFFKKRIFKHKL